MPTLPKQTKADRRKLAAFSDADIAATIAFIDGLKAPGEALEGRRTVTLSAAAARQLWHAGRKRNPVTWNASTLQFMRGRNAIPRPIIKAGSEALVTHSRFKMMDAALRLQQGKLTVAEWIEEHNRFLKLSEGAQSALGRGGFLQMSDEAWSKASESVAKQLGYSRNFAKDVAAGRYGVPGKDMGDAVLQRTGLYASAGRGTYENTLRDVHRENGFEQAKRVMAAVIHCDQCKEEAAKGWMPIDEVVPIGECSCLSNCHCALVFQRGGA